MTPAERATKLNELIAHSAQRLPSLTDREVSKAMQIIHQNRVQLVDQLLANSGADGKVKRERAEGLLNSLSTLQHQLNDGLVDSVKSAYEVAVERAGGDIQKAFNEAGMPAVGLNFNNLSSDTLAYLAKRFSGEEGGLVLSDRIWNMTKDQQGKLNEVLTNGILQGKSNSTLRKEVMAVYNTSRFNADRLIRTETNTAYRVAFAKSAESAYVTEEYLEIVKGVADRPEHECTILSEEDPYGKGPGVWKASDSQIYNPHPNCTSYLLYYINEDKVAEAMSFEDEEPADAIPDPENVAEGKEFLDNLAKRTAGTKGVALEQVNLDQFTPNVRERLWNEYGPKGQGIMTDDMRTQYFHTRADWIMSSVIEGGATLQNDLADIFNMPANLKVKDKLTGKLPRQTPLSKATTELIYNDTQNVLAEAGVTHLKVYRGIKVPKGEKVSWVKEIDDGVVVNGRPAASWSISEDVANRFAEAGARTDVTGGVIEAIIPKEQAVMFLENREYEVIVAGEVKGRWKS
jgi:hypothetical protein